MKKILKYIGKIIMFFSKQILQAILVVTLFFAIIVGATTVALTEYKKDIEIEENSYLELDFSKGIVEKNEDGRYTKYQDTIVQYFHKIRIFQKLSGLKLVDKQTFSLYDTEDKTLLIFKKK